MPICPGQKTSGAGISCPFRLKKTVSFFYKYTPNYLRDKYGLQLQTNPMEVFQTDANQMLPILQNALSLDLVLDGGNVVKCGEDKSTGEPECRIQKQLAR